MTFEMAVVALFLVLDPLGNVPVCAALLKDFPPRQQTRIILRESGIAFLILLVFLFFGRPVLHAVGITLSALRISGGIILFLLALRMIFPPPKDTAERLQEAPLIVPLAVPLMAGPSAIAMVMIFASQESARMTEWFFAVLSACVLSTLILLSSRHLVRLLGRRGLMALERLMGMVLTILAVQMFLAGVADYFQLAR